MHKMTKLQPPWMLPVFDPGGIPKLVLPMELFEDEVSQLRDCWNPGLPPAIDTDDRSCGERMSDDALVVAAMSFPNGTSLAEDGFHPRRFAVVGWWN